MIVWGGTLNGGSCTYTGGRYDPATNTWQPTRADATTAHARQNHTAIWTGSRMIVWGGSDNGTYPLTYQTGGRYDAVADTWESIRLDATTPGSRSGHFAVWTGTRMVIWGGFHNTNPNSPAGVYLTTGAQYDPLSDTWQPTRNDGTQPPAGTIRHAIWTGNEWLLWGYTSSTPFPPIGRRYDPAEDLWSPMSTDGPAPSPRGVSSAVWTGQEMIVWGGIDIPTGKRLNTGGRYDPASDTWVPTAADQSAPGPRFAASAVWTGSEMIVWGGTENNPVKTGHRYDPATDSWQPVLADASAPAARSRPSAVWTGREMIIWGGDLATGGRYNPAADSWLPTRFDFSTPSARSQNTAVWTGTEMIVWGGSGLKTGGRYNPDSDSWIATRDDATAPAARSRHSAVWTGSEMIIWGGEGFDGAANTGGRYSPLLDTWVPTRVDISTPPARQLQSAVWTGDRMIVWGGVAGPSFTHLQTGGRYDPNTDSWVSTALTAPSARYGHSAHWAGSGMIIWGGNASGLLQNTGGLYHPGFNTWTPTPIDANTPSPRENHVSALSGNGLIVWSGQGQGFYQADSGAELCLCSPAATWYLDSDGDGFGGPSAIVSSCSQPAGYVATAGDCNDEDASSWSTPGEALDFMFDDETQMHWSPPASPGGLQPIYDVLRSQAPDDFVGTAVCISTVTPTAFDAEVPPAGAAFFFRVRARNGCGGIGGPLGNDSSGTPVAGRACP
jgi:N-acetylneuraminic acid mutarotase